MRLAACVLGLAALTGCGSDSERGSTGTGESVATYGPLTPANAPRRKEEHAPARPRGAARPVIVAHMIPFPAKRKREMAAYSKRHYGEAGFRLEDPKVIVEHFTETDSTRATYDIFAPDVADTELHELPQVCSHFVIGQDGTIEQLVPLSIRCRHVVGLNHTAIGIEHVGHSDAEVLGNGAQLRASLRLTRWLRCRYGIELRNVIGHNESLSSPYHHENVARLRTQTHDDFNRASMQEYRRRLGRAAC